MLKRKNRLRGKDVNFLVRKRQYFVSDYFWFFYFTQYPNLKFNQISVNIPVKFSKRAVQRVWVKRQINSYIKKNWFDQKSIDWNYYKVFVTMNKNKLWILKSQIEKLDKKESNHYIVSEFEKSFCSFLKKIWNKKNQ
jgi:ribonuclease P protein component